MLNVSLIPNDYVEHIASVNLTTVNGKGSQFLISKTAPHFSRSSTRCKLHCASFPVPKAFCYPVFLSERDQASKEYMKDETVKIANSVNH